MHIAFRSALARALAPLLLLVAAASPLRAGAAPGGAATAGTAANGVDPAVVAAIREEALQRSQAMDHVGWLADVYGPRVTGSPAIEQAAGWAMATLRGWGVQNVRLERFPFGRGWSVERFSLNLVEPQRQPLIAYPRAWSGGTDGPVTAAVVRVSIDDEQDMERYRGTLRGRIVLTQPAREVRPLRDPVVLRMDEAMLREATTMPGADDDAPAPDFEAARRRREFAEKLPAFWASEGVVAVLDRGSDSDAAAGGSDLSWRTQRVDGGTIFVGSGGSRDVDAAPGVPMATLAVEHYNRLVRVLERGLPVTLEIDQAVRFWPEPAGGNGFNILGEIPGTDLADEVVMIGAHFDSTQAGTGATDNATGVAVMMETMRVLLATNARPRRTVRIGLWGGEEQGLMGSREYARRTFGDVTSGDMTPEWHRFSTYFNLDNGTGRIRGVWLQQNDAASQLLARWMEFVADLGVSTLGPRSVGGTDHLAFDDVGLPGFQFMQDRVEYNSRTHHSNMDVVDHVVAEDVVQAAAVLAVFTYAAASSNEKMPRKPLPEVQ